MVRILYAVQGTGNGHISRARVMAPKLRKAGFDVTFLFSGRARAALFEMEIFDDFLWREGLTFAVSDGRIRYLETALKNNLLRFISDIRTLDLSAYDLIISDYEPVTSWAARKQGIPILGIGHQYAFHYPIPTTGGNLFTYKLMRYFAPAQTRLGLHWHHFGQPILPPIVEIPDIPKTIERDSILVYLPIEKASSIVDLLKGFTDHRFIVFHPHVPDGNCPKNIEFHSISRQGFQRMFALCNGVLTNAGFELTSEALQAGKKILAKPLLGQFEQLSNALALQNCGLGSVMHTLSAASVARWLSRDERVQVVYPDTAQLIVDHLNTEGVQFNRDWFEAAWHKVVWTNPVPGRHSEAA
ncbi:MAG TPA: glycosyltransferase [Chromatiaceae bacterium]|nr:glycosyltransferase [Chromatiaceae bacterium]